MVTFIALILLSGCSSQNESYKVGHDAGMQASADNVFFYQEDQPINICKLMVEMSKRGTPSDAIDWQKINSEDFVKGCMDAYAEEHGGLRTNQIRL